MSDQLSEAIVQTLIEKDIELTRGRVQQLRDGLLCMDVIIDRLRHMTTGELREYGEDCTCQISPSLREVRHDPDGCSVCGVEPYSRSE